MSLEKRGQFRVNKRKKILDHYGMEVIFDEVTKPDGSGGEYAWVNFPRQVVLIFPIDKDGYIYLTKEFTYATNKYSLEVPGGVINEGETPELAAERESLEELGIKISSLEKLTILHENTSRVNNTSHLFLANVKSWGKTKLESGEDISLVKVTVEEAYKKVLSGEISTATVATGILLMREHLR